MILPEDFIRRTESILEGQMEAFVSALQQPSPVSIRKNNKINIEAASATIPINPEIQYLENVPWCEDGIYLKERPLFTADPMFHGGAYYVQEASSMFIRQALKCHISHPRLALDLCAAPGGKSTLLRQYLSDDCLLISNEIIRQRANILAENLIKWGNPNIVVTNNSPVDFRTMYGMFDLILVDAPCSGEGMFRKDPDAISEWSENQVQVCASRQTDILNDIWDALSENGILIYSTCTYNLEENEKIAAWISEELGGDILEMDISQFPGITKSPGGYRFYPHLIKGEGFFMTVIRKTSSSPASPKLKNKKDKSYLKINPSTLRFLPKEPGQYEFLQIDSEIKAFPKERMELHLYLQHQLNCLENGLNLAEIKGKDQIPAYQLALSTELDTEKTNYADLNYDQAISFLKKENLNLHEEPTGYLLVGYKGLPLGWVKNLGNRCNNLYPQHWRIRMNL